MKTILFAFLFLFVPKFCFAQISANDDVVYLDSIFHTATAENYKYIRIIKDFAILGKESYFMGVYYKSGNIMMRGTTTTRIGIAKNGTFSYFYENGERKSVVNYEKDILVGSYFEFHENGKIKLEGEWCDNKNYVIPHVKIKNCWNENGIKTITEGSGCFEEIYAKGSLINENDVIAFGHGKIINNLKDSIWSGYDKRIKADFQEIYYKGKLISGVSIDSNKVKYKYTVKKIRPGPKKGMEDFYNHVSKTFRTPNIEGLKGTIILQFEIETDGSITDIKVVKDLGYDTGQEAIRTLKEYNNGWNPSEQRGVKVRFSYLFPISIQTAN